MRRVETTVIRLSLIFAAALVPTGGLHAQQSIAQQEVALIQQAGKYFDAKDYANAIQTYKSVIALNPKMAAPHSGLGEVYLAEGQYQLAVKEYKQYFVLGAPDPLVLTQLGDAYGFLGQYDQAIATYQKAMAQLPPYQDLATSQLYQRIGTAYAFAKQYANAIPAFQKSLQLISPNDPATYGLGFSYAGAGQKAEAMQIYQQLLGSSPDLAKKLYNVINGANPAKNAPAQPGSAPPKPTTNKNSF